MNDFNQPIPVQDAETQLLLTEIRDSMAALNLAVDQLEQFTDGLEGFTDGLEGLLTTLRDNTDQLEGFVDGLEGLSNDIKTLTTNLDNKTPTLGQKNMAGSTPVVLASDQYNADSIPLTTREFRSKMSDLSKGFLTSTNNLSKGTAESPALLFRNPANSGRVINLYSFNFSGAGTFRIYITPTISAVGTPLPVVNKRIGSGAASTSLLYTNPTATANGNMAYIYPVSAQNGFALFTFEGPVILLPGFDLMVTTTMAANGTITNIGCQWSEV